VRFSVDQNDTMAAVVDRPLVSSFDGRSRKLPLVAYLALLVAGMLAAHAEDGRVARPSEPIEFNIPAQSLANALQDYGQTTGIQVLYESNSAVSRMSAAVQGKFAPDTALNLLLTGTGLKVRYIRPDAITLALPDADGPGVPSSTAPSASSSELSLGTLRVHRSGDDATRLRDYSQSVQMDIQNALRKNAKTRDGSYRAVLDLWIDPASTIERTELFRSTGDRDRDAAVTTTLRGVTISRPTPVNTPQPIRVVIVVRSLP
jgi:TonB C terminal